MKTPTPLIIATASALFATQLAHAALFPTPAGGWNYMYDGSGVQGVGTPKASVALDGTWSANNGSSEWDGSLRGAGNGLPGGISSSGGVLTIEDINNGSGSLNNRKIYFTHDLAQEGIANAGKILDNGITLTFRGRLTQPGIQPPAEFAVPDGWGIFSDGKANFNIHQFDGTTHKIIGFSLVRASEPDNGFVFNSAGLTYNRLNGDAPAGSSAVNSTTTAANNPILTLDPNDFHEFWVTIQANDNTAGNGTHTVSIFMDGGISPVSTFNVTAGTGNENNTSYLGLGLNNSTGEAAVDIDFFGYKSGVFTPVPEPSTLAFLGLGSALLISRLRRKA